MAQTQRITIIGAGSWGSTLASLFARAGHAVTIWTRSAEKAETIRRERRIEAPVLVEFPDTLVATANLQEALSAPDIVIFCCPSQSLRETVGLCKELIDKTRLPILISAVKGLELATFKRMSEVIIETLPQSRVACLSGPNLAAEIISGMPAAAVVACEFAEVASQLQATLTLPKFRLYSNTDIIGVELGGTLKNIIAIAAGVSDGLALGANAKAALLTRGLAEITRLAVNLGAKPMTMAGLAGMGDLLATTAGPSSRNYRLGFELAKGRRTEEILASMKVAVEGVPTAQAVCELSKRLKLDMPIAVQVEATLKGESSPEKAIMALMSRPLASE